MNNELTKNLLFALGVENNEVVMCRLLRYLLMDKKLFEGFMKNVLLCSDDKGRYNLDDYRVTLEYPVKIQNIKGDRRCDIVITTKVGAYEFIYPIEVKLYAVDQPNQLYDYYKFFFNDGKDENIKNREEKIYYLTINGKLPSMESRVDLDNQIVCISFEETIMNWLENSKEIDNVFLSDLINQLIGIIKLMNPLEPKAKFVEGLINNAGIKNLERDFIPEDFNNEEYLNQIVAFIRNCKEEVIYIGVDTNVYVGVETKKYHDKLGEGWNHNWPKGSDRGISWKHVISQNSVINPLKYSSNVLNDTDLVNIVGEVFGSVNINDLVYSMVNYYE